jgi:sugar-specific transcriptional regulator TrmB
MLSTILKSFQLSETEIRLFLKVLELGGQPASNIARVCEMPRNTVRSILDNLVKKGLMVKTNRAKTQYYATENKDNLIRLLKFRRMRQNEETERQIELLNRYGDELSARHWAQSRPRITFYEGHAGLEKVYEDTLTAKAGLRSWASYDDLHAEMNEYATGYYKRRAEKGIPMRSIHPDTPMSRAAQARDKQELRQSALVPKEKFSLSPEIQIYNNKINIVSGKDKLGIIIESQEIADAMRAIFDMSFETAKRYGNVTNHFDYDAMTEKQSAE